MSEICQYRELYDLNGPLSPDHSEEFNKTSCPGERSMIVEIKIEKSLHKTFT